MDKKLLYLLENNINKHLCVMHGTITSFDIIKYESTARRDLKQAYMVAYCIYGNSSKKSKYLCWYCSYNHDVFEYETIMGTYIHLHKYCYETAASYRKKCAKRNLGQYQFLSYKNYYIVYNLTQLYIIICNNYSIIPYNKLIHYTKPYPTEEFYQVPYHRLVKKIFIRKHLDHFMFIHRLVFEEIEINRIIHTFYFNLIMI